MDRTLDPNTIFNFVPHWVSAGDCGQRYPLFGADLVPGGPGTLQFAQSAGCSAFFKSLAENPQAFSNALDTVLNGPFAVTTIQASIDAYQAFLQPHIDASSKDNSAEWNAGVAKLRGDIQALHNRANSYKIV